MVDEYQSLSDRVDPSRWDEYLQALKTGRENLGRTITWQPAADQTSHASPAPKSDNAAVLPTASAILGVILALVIAAFQGADF
jgi:hypothetical protein